MKLDQTDFKILDCLTSDAKQPTRQIAKKLNIPITTVHNRIKKLEQEKIITKYIPVLDYKKLGKYAYALVLIKTKYDMIEGKNKNQEDVAREIKIFPGVEEVCSVTGIIDLIVRVRQDSIEELNNFLINKLRKISGVAETQNMIVLNSI